MIEGDLIERLTGEWQGSSSLQVDPGEPVRDSQSWLRIKPVVKSKFVQIDYTWSEKGKQQEGLLLVGYRETGQVATAVWLDSWHMGDEFMVCQGSLDEDGTITLLGSYSASGGPDWGWRIVLWLEGDSLQLRMLNIHPEGQELWAVRATYSKVD